MAKKPYIAIFKKCSKLIYQKTINKRWTSWPYKQN